MTINKLILMLLLILFPLVANAGTHHRERVYQEAWCKVAKGKTEYRLDNGTRVDCLTTNYAVEVEFASNWYEAVGQALYYAKKTERKPAILLIIEKDTDWKYKRRLKYTVEETGITVWYITPEDLN